MLSQSTKRSGTIFLPMVMSKGTSRKWSQIWYATVTLPIEKLLEPFIGVPCVQSYDVSSKVKVLEPSLILNCWVASTEEAINPGFKKRVNSHNNLLYVRALQGHSAGELLAPELMNHVACSTQMVGIPVSCGKVFLP